LTKKFTLLLTKCCMDDGWRSFDYTKIEHKSNAGGIKTAIIIE